MNISRLTQKVWLEVILLKKLRMMTTKKHGKISRIIFVISHCVLLIGFLVFFFIIM